MAGAGGNTIGGCADPLVVSPLAIPALGLVEMSLLIVLLAGAGLFVLSKFSVQRSHPVL
jgi:hypothetical protein